MRMNIYLLFIFLIIFFILPFKTFAGDCWQATLEVKVLERSQHEETGRKGQVLKIGRLSHNVEAQGHVMFVAGEGKTKISSKTLSGSASTRSFRETSCTTFEGHTEGMLTEGFMKNSKIHAPHWKYTHKGITTIKPIKGCMQDPIPPIEGVDEVADYRFEGIVRPTIGKLVALCESVKKTPDIGFCKETPQGFSGQMIQRSLQVGIGFAGERIDADFTSSEVYSWNAKRVPCECSASITFVKGDVRLNGIPIKEKADFNLSGAVIETVGRSRVVIQAEDGAVISLGPKTILDLSDLCKQIEKEPKEPRILKVIRGSFNFILLKVYGPIPYQYRITPTAGGIRGSLDKEPIYLAFAGIIAQDSPLIVSKISKQNDLQSELELESEEIKRADVALFYDFNPDERYLSIHVIKGRVKIRDSDGRERYAKAGEKLHKTWSKSSEFKSIDVIISR